MHFGGQTCGSGEIGSGVEQHESCCKSLEVPGFSDPLAPGKRVFVLKYEVTAGRMREFIRVVSDQYAGVPNVRAWVQAQPELLAWHADSTPFLPAGFSNDEGWGFHYTFSAIADGSADFSSGFYVHGQNCAVGQGRPGFPTYWYPDEVTTGVLQGIARRYDQQRLDVKALSCVPQAMLAAFCLWDGGVMASAAVIDAITSAGRPRGSAINRTNDAGNGNGPYQYEVALGVQNGVVVDGAGRVAPPGRIPEDKIPSPDGDAWMDLGGNMMEQVRNDGQRAYGLRKWGLGEGSVGAQNTGPNQYAQPAFKYAGAGGRCMRFR